MRRAFTVVAAVAIPVALVVALAFALGACGEEAEGPAASPTATASMPSPARSSPAASPAGSTTLALYFLRGDRLGVAHRTVPATTMPATAAMTLLLEGPDARERVAGLTTAVPAGTRLNGVAVADGVARVDLDGRFEAGGGSASMQARVAQVVYTLTQFPTVRAVRFLIDGRPVTALGGEGLMLDRPQRRADWEGLLPAIFVETPAVGDVITSPVRVTGSASVFEATFVVELVRRGGTVLGREVVTASEGAPGRGSFTARLTFEGAGDVVLRVYQESMEDGTPLDEVRIPVRAVER